MEIFKENTLKIFYKIYRRKLVVTDQFSSFYFMIFNKYLNNLFTLEDAW